MITGIRFKNFKALKDAELKLGPFNLIVGPNGSGKTSVLQAFEILANPNQFAHREFRTLGSTAKEFSIDARWNPSGSPEWGGFTVASGICKTNLNVPNLSSPPAQLLSKNMAECFQSVRVYALEPSKMSQPVHAQNVKELNKIGDNLAGALTHLRDQDEDAYDHLRAEFQRWLPEFDSIVFKNDQNGYRQLSLRQSATKLHVPASELSEGTLIALALLAIVYQPGAPTIIGLEEPDRALHPRLLRDVRDALYRLSFPIDFGLKRKPVQIIATTHSPYFLDLFKEHPEQIIIAEKQKDGTATFKSLADDEQLREIIGDAPLGEVWYSGVLGGVPA